MMGKHKGIFEKPGSSMLYYRYTLANGKRVFPPSGYEIGLEEEAAKTLAIIKRQIAAERDFQKKASAGAQLPTKGVTVQSYGEHWNAKRLKDPSTEQAATEDKWKLEGHIYPALGHVLLVEFRTRHGRDFVAELRTKKRKNGEPLAPRTMRSIWSALHNLFQEAVVDELIPINPCTLRRGDLPPNEDKDPEWRDGAVFERYEVEQLISDERLPMWRRVLWGALFLAGPRPGEVFAAHWSNYDARAQPLGRLTLVKAWNTRYKRVGRTKTKRRRLVPVHPTLAKLLAEWKLSGWEAHIGRKPGPEDLIIPNPEGGHLRVDDTLDWIREDLVTLGLRADRRQYDTRRTFNSLAQGDGASPDLIRWVLWGARGNVADDYTSIPWVPICNEVVKLRVELLEGRLVPLAKVSGEIETVKETVFGLESKSPMISRADIRTRTGDLLITKATRGRNPRQPLHVIGNHNQGMPRGGGGGSGPPSETTVSLSHPDPESVAADLEAAAWDWARNHDPAALRERLEALLGVLQ